MPINHTYSWDSQCNTLLDMYSLALVSHLYTLEMWIAQPRLQAPPYMGEGPGTHQLRMCKTISKIVRIL